MKCSKCFKTGEIIPKTTRCRKCVNEYKNNWERKKKNRLCAYCKKEYIPISVSKECSLQCKLLNGKKEINGCWEWQRKITKGGYGELQHENKMLAHRASYTVFKGKIPKGKHVCHKCDNRKCINPEHLWIGTHQQNMDDAKKKGRLSKQPMKKFTDMQIREIKEHLSKGRTTTSLSKDYGVSQALIWYIKAGKHYRGVT